MQIYNLENKTNDLLVAEVIVFDDGQTVVKWKGTVQSLVIFKNLDEFKQVSVINHERILFQIC